MAISYIVGIPRSGKSYLAVFKLWKHFIYQPKETFLTRLLLRFKKPTPKVEYEVAYTNINQFDFSKSDKIKQLDFPFLKAQLAELHMLYKQGSDDDLLIEKAKEMGLYKALFVLDECHNFLKSKEDEVLVWWFTYHGHLYQDLWLITQDLTLVNNEYKRIAEFFYKAVPPAQRLSTKRFRYVQFSNYKMHLNGVIKGGGYDLPALPEVFSMYVSGAQNNAKSVVQKYIFFAVFIAMLLVPMVFWFLSSFETKTPVDENVTLQQYNQSPQTLHVKSTPEIPKADKFFYYEIDCLGDYCYYDNIQFPLVLFNRILNENEKEFFYFISNFSHKTYFLMFEKDVFKFLQEVKKDEKVNASNPNFKLF